MTHPGSGGGHGPPITAIKGGMMTCWACRRPVSVRALFCHGCGTVQPVRPHDHFNRLGLERRFDLDQALLERRHAGFRRTLAPERFAGKSARERALIQAQTDAYDQAFEALRDPVRRARYLLQLDGATVPAGDAGADLDALHEALCQARDAAAVDRLANRMTGEIESAVLQLSAAFRAGDRTAAAGMLSRLERLDTLSTEARARRAEVQ